MTPELLSTKLRAGEHVFGTVIASNSPRWPKVVAGIGLDFVFIDTEHVAIDRTEVAWMCQAYSALGIPPIVRIPSPDPYQATQFLDGGADGIIAPYVETVEQVQALRGAIKCRPIKGRVLAQHLSGEQRFAGELGAYVQRGSKGNLFVVNIESVPAIENLDAILAVEGLDAVLIGPHDLSCSLGVPEQYNHPDYERACRTIFKKARAAGVGAGCHSFYGDIPQQIRWMKEAGENLVIHSADLLAFAKAMTADIAELRRAVNAEVKAKGETVNI